MMHLNPDMILYEDAGEVHSLDVSPEGSLLATAHGSSLRICYPMIQEELWRFEVGVELLVVRFSPDGRFLAAGGAFEGLEVWDLSTGEKWELPTSGQNEYVEFIPVSNQVAAVSRDGSCVIWNPEDPGTSELQFDGASLRDFSSSPDGTLLAVAQGTEVQIWDVRRLGLLRSFGGHRSPLRAATFSANSRYVYSADERGQLIMWDVDTLRTQWATPPKDVSTKRLAVDYPGSRLAAAYEDRTIEIFDANRGDLQLTLYPPNAISALKFSPIDRYLAVAGRGGVHLWHGGAEVVRSDKFPGATAEGWITKRQ
jgi:WD40 repeat protein